MRTLVRAVVVALLYLAAAAYSATLYDVAGLGGVF